MNEHAVPAADAASFRDPSGFIFRDGEGRLCRQINPIYLPHYRRLMESGLYQELVDGGFMIEHRADPAADPAAKDGGPLRIYPREIPFISYPYEWSFGMLKDAALLTMAIQLRAMKHGMSLKDASAYNVQFEGTRAVFIDTLSFEPLKPGAPWIAYGQFCRHFLAPLALMCRTDNRLQRLLADFLDGIPLDLAVRLLPWRTRFEPGLLMHLRLHSRAVVRHQPTDRPATDKAAPTMSATALERLLGHLEETTRRQAWPLPRTEWINYYQDHSYTAAMQDAKVRLVKDFLGRLKPATVWDLGANTGLFSRVALETGARVVAIDSDAACVERIYLDAGARGQRRLLPLCMDLANPSSGRGWAHRERRSLTQRGPADAVMALALIHHLAVSNNVPFAMIADWFAALGKSAVVEYVPKSDSQTQRLLQSREDVFADYTQEAFETALSRRFTIADKQPVPDSGRTLYLLTRR
jgi:ribosomal protein L11 methylase PrmA